ncbi:hypothetical protein KC19_6G091600 [Ceratodon purpureus]|uniref:Uncharacterized protein n=1 Tax=Ceratodon purpureus TaxID=3225 RepID=A0A8T0HFQ7_CERPU|nr:hypothetical protein KC19_6G091600 [Ceratodon purpureus]
MTEVLKRGWEQRKWKRGSNGNRERGQGNSEARPQAADLGRGAPGEGHKRRGDRSQRGRARSKRCRRCCTALPISLPPSLLERAPSPALPSLPPPFPFSLLCPFLQSHHSLPSHVHTCIIAPGSSPPDHHYQGSLDNFT